MTPAPESKDPTPEAQLRSFVDKFDPKHQKLFRSVRTALRKRFPTANELVYEYADSVVISYTPNRHGIDGIVSIALRADGLRLYLMNGPQLPDPKELLLGTGKQTRYVEVGTARQLSTPDVDALIAAALERAKVPLPSEGGGVLVIQSSAVKKKTRRKPAK
ncbi:MAG: hypothetical protein U1F36_22170 [Planctomycetota bacterium]